MEHRELTAEELARKLGCADAVVQGIIAGTVAIDSGIATGLSKHVGGTPRFWETRERNYQNALSRVAAAVSEDETSSEWIKRFPHRELAKYGWVKHPRMREELVKAYLAYFGVTAPAEWKERYARFLTDRLPKFSNVQIKGRATFSMVAPWRD